MKVLVKHLHWHWVCNLKFHIIQAQILWSWFHSLAPIIYQWIRVLFLQIQFESSEKAYQPYIDGSVIHGWFLDPQSTRKGLRSVMWVKYLPITFKKNSKCYAQSSQMRKLHHYISCFWWTNSIVAPKEVECHKTCIWMKFNNSISSLLIWGCERGFITPIVRAHPQSQSQSKKDDYKHAIEKEF